MTHKIVVTALCLLIMLPIFSKRIPSPSEIPGKVIEITSVEQFNSILIDKKYKIIKFYNPDCPHCKRVKKLYEELAKDFPYISFLAIRARTNPTLSNKYDIKRVPVFIILDQENKEVDRIKGEITKSSFKSRIEPFAARK